MITKELISVASIPVVGILAQWVSWRLRIPSILLLLIVGILVGPILGFLDPDALVGNILQPFVSLSVAIILFEGGLSLKLEDIASTGRVVRNLISTGAIVTWVGVSVMSYFLLDLNIIISVLIGAILVVTGPTVVIPLLRHIRVERQLSSILRWEGIMIDPVGATLSVLVFEIVLSQGSQDVFGLLITLIFLTLICGIFFGSLGALTIMHIFKRHWVPEYLQESITLIFVIFVYTISHYIQTESGLLAVTVMGLVLANQKMVPIKHIITFKENLTILLLSVLFVVLAARVDINMLQNYLNLKTFLFVCSLIFIVRPLAVFMSSINSGISIKHKIFLSFMAPRGIVAAAIASLFAFRLSEVGIPQSDHMVSVTFIIIIVSVTFYGLLGRPIAKLLSVQQNNQGLLIAGAHSWARKIARILVANGVHVIMVDTNKENILSARALGLRGIHGSILSKQIAEEIALGNVGQLLALTPSDETNILAFVEYSGVFGKLNVYRLFSKDKTKDFSKYRQGFLLFGKGVTYSYISALLTAGAKITTKKITSSFNFTDYKKKYSKCVPLFAINQSGDIQFFCYEKKVRFLAGQTLISIVSKF
ncbi:hypothetical protein DID75_04295 [Candidatus Marinamargulisbacteria bacterium SCGC AG-410-N11]|nr:hypothetical protein DID75_04295 [Candidatus Marinamargulisbacteria bacterium SCGC AG-410-N11]